MAAVVAFRPLDPLTILGENMASYVEAIAQLRPELCGPDYNIYRYRHDYFKVVRFASTALRVGPPVRSAADGFKHEDKLPAALSRARRVCLELALCNDWKWFCTFTIAENNYDRKNLDGYYKRFKEWLKYQSSKLGVPLPYLLVPEQHGDGSWHMHGFFTAAIDPLLVPFRDLWKAGEKIPYKLVRKGYYNLPKYQERFGFCSFGEIRDHIATAHYTTKYISKSFMGDARRVGLNLYYCSQGLNRSSLYGDIYGRSSMLDQMLQHHYEFCSTGFVQLHREPGDDPMQDLIDEAADQMQPIDLEAFYNEHYAAPEIPEDDPCSDDFYQISLWAASKF